MKSLFRIAFFFTVTLSIPRYILAQSFPESVPDKNIAIPGNGGYASLAMDSAAGRLYISHGTQVVVFDVATEQLIGSINNMVGVHGIAIASSFKKGFISDGKGNALVVFDLQTLKVIKTIPVSGEDPDAILYDPFSQKVFAFNGDSQNASVIDAATLQQTGTIALGGTPEFAVSDGEGKIYSNTEDKNIVHVIDAKTEKIIRSIPLDPCGGPTGLALDKKNQRLFTVCRKNKGMSVIDIVSGKVISTIPIGAGVDAVVYDAPTGIIFCSNGDGTATIIHQDSPDSYSVVQTLSTQWKAKTLAFDSGSRKLYFSAFDMEPGTKNRIPGSFKLLIYKPKS